MTPVTRPSISSLHRVGMGLAVLLWAAGPARASGEAASGEAAELAREVASLRQQVDLASGKAFYLLLDPVESTLELVLHGVVLETYAVSSIEVGWPRVAFVGHATVDGWRERAWTHGEMDPVRAEDRLEIRVDADNPPPEEMPVPLTPEERFPAPDRWLVRYEEDLSLEIVADDAEESSFRPWSALARRAEDLSAALFGDRETRVRVTLPREGAATLYRSLPPASSLLILPGPSGS